MFYIETSNPGEAIHLTPITNDNIYTHCESCGKMVQVNDLLDYIEELAEVEFHVETHNTCDKCLEELYRLEDEYVKTH